MGVAQLVERGLIGGLFVGHGTQKLFGWFGGPGRAGTEGMMAALSMHPAKANALAAGITETACGAMLAAGLGTPVAAAALTGVMTTAIRKVHLPNGLWASNGGWEYNAVLIAAVIALAESGPGDLSLDHLLDLELHRPEVGVRCAGARGRDGAAHDGRRPAGHAQGGPGHRCRRAGRPGRHRRGPDDDRRLNRQRLPPVGR